MTAKQSQKLFDQAKEELRLAQETLEAGRYGEAEKLAFRASDSIAAGYMARLDARQAGGKSEQATKTTEAEAERASAQNDNTAPALSTGAFEKFVSHIWNAGTTPEETQNIRGIVGDIRALREAHDWSLPDEITRADAELTLQRVEEILEGVENGWSRGF